jgi:hypothetical protein
MYSGPVRCEFANYDPDETVVFEHDLTGRAITRHHCPMCRLTAETYVPFRVIDPEVET